MKSIGRNSPCPCGSGKKYKKCCLLTNTQRRKTTQPSKFRFEPGSYGHPESCVPSIACLHKTGDSWEYHFVLVKPDDMQNNPDHANSIATSDLNTAFSKKASSGSDEAVAMSLRECGYVSVDDFNVVAPNADPSFGWMENDGLHLVAPGSQPTPGQLDAASKVYQESIRNSPMWDQMVKEFGEDEAERLLSQCRVEESGPSKG